MTRHFKINVQFGKHATISMKEKTNSLCWRKNIIWTLPTLQYKIKVSSAQNDLVENFDWTLTFLLNLTPKLNLTQTWSVKNLANILPKEHFSVFMILDNSFGKYLFNTLQICKVSNKIFCYHVVYFRWKIFFI